MLGEVEAADSDQTRDGGRQQPDETVADAPTSSRSRPATPARQADSVPPSAAIIRPAKLAK